MKKVNDTQVRTMRNPSNKIIIDNDENQPEDSNEESEQLHSLAIGKLLPANQIISKAVKSDSEVKIIIKANQQKFQNELWMVNKIESEAFSGLEGKKKMCFEENDTLGYEYQSKFKKYLVYSRLMNSIAFSQWQKLISCSQQNGKQECPKVGSKQKAIKYLSGIFTHPQRSKLSDGLNDKQKQNQRIDECHLLEDNLQLIVNAEQQNYFPSFIKFSAKNQSANLMYAFQTKMNEFDLILHNDTNSKGSTQWFNFSCQILYQPTKTQTIKFNIVNLTKCSTLFTKGMRIVYKHKKDKNWKKLPSAVTYTSSNVEIEGRQGVPYRTLSFVYETKLSKNYQKYGNEVVSFSYWYPYTLKDSHNFWSEIERVGMNQNRNKSKFTFNKVSIGRSSSGISIQAIKIIQQQKRKSATSISSTNWFSSQSIHSNKNKSLVFLARQHPGETQGSFVMQGIVQSLFSTQNLANLKKNFVFHFIPIVNPEGILFGNYRTNLKGYDLNRNWRNPVNEAQPQIVAIKKYLCKINKENQICLIIDLHGHSKSMNSFFYGANNINILGRKKKREDVKLFPFFCSKRMKQISYDQCYFNVSEGKKNTARAVLSEMFPQALVYTLQNSFYGYYSQQDKGKIVEYTPNELRKFGGQLITAYLQFSQMGQTMKRPSVSPSTMSLKVNNWSKETLMKELENLQKNRWDLRKVEKQPQQSDSEAEQELIDCLNTSQIIKQQMNELQIEEENKTITQNKERKLNTYIHLRQKTNIHNTQNQGKFLKTIEMVETTRSEIYADDYIHKYDKKATENKPGSKVKASRQKESYFDEQKENIPVKPKYPLLTICVLKPKVGDLSELVNNAVYRNRPRIAQNIKLKGENQLTSEETKARNLQEINKCQHSSSELKNNNIKSSNLNHIGFISESKERSDKVLMRQKLRQTHINLF